MLYIPAPFVAFEVGAGSVTKALEAMVEEFHEGAVVDGGEAKGPKGGDRIGMFPVPIQLDCEFARRIDGGVRRSAGHHRRSSR